MDVPAIYRGLLPARTSRAVPCLCSQDDIGALLAACDTTFTDERIAATGLRIGKVRRLRVDDIDPAHRPGTSGTYYPTAGSLDLGPNPTNPTTPSASRHPVGSPDGRFTRNYRSSAGRGLRVVNQSANRYFGRAGSYDRGCPGYPESVVDVISLVGGVESPATLVDLGAGTGILTEQLLLRGYKVWAIENDPVILSFADEHLASFDSYRSICAPAEETTLPDRCAAAVTIGQALHWFRPDLLRVELQRVLAPGGALFAVWNETDRSPGSPGEVLDQLLADALPRYAEARANDPDPMALLRAVAPGSARLSLHRARHYHLLTAAKFRDRILSASYAPCWNDVATLALTRRVDHFFEKHQVSGQLRLGLVTTAVLAQQVHAQIDASTAP